MRKRLAMPSTLVNTRSNHLGLWPGIKRNAINRAARARGAAATLTNHTIRSIRSTTGSCAAIQALIARQRMKKVGSLTGSSASLAATSRHSSRQIERLRAAAGSKRIPQARQRCAR